MHSPRSLAVLICVVIGMLGGALCIRLVHATLVTGVMLGGLYGAVFALLAAPRAVSPGAGLIWGLGYALVLWLAIPAGILTLPTHGGLPECQGWSTPAAPTFQSWWPTCFALVCRLGSAWAPGERYADQQASRILVFRAR